MSRRFSKVLDLRKETVSRDIPFIFSKPFRGRYDQAYSDYEESMIGAALFRRLILN